ncbi:MAG: nitroreductase family protein [Halodesulfurarchaeum sp.]
MDVTDAIRTRLDIRDYAEESVPTDTKRAILEAGRLASSGRNLQHWDFVLLQDPSDLDRLAAMSPTGQWVGDADFAIVVLTDPSYDFHEIDAGRALTYMQLEAWDRGVASGIYTEPDESAIREFLDYPESLTTTLVAGFGYPTKPVESFEGRKDREPLSSVAHLGRYGRDPPDPAGK